MIKPIKILLVFSLLFVVSCGKNKDEKSDTRHEPSKIEIGASEKYLREVENVHKKEDFLKESHVAFKFDINFSGTNISGKIHARTDLSEFKVATKANGNWYFDVLDDAYVSGENQKDVEQLISFLVGNYCLFYNLSGKNFNYTEKEKQHFFDRDFTKVSLVNKNKNRFIPEYLDVFVEDRTNMLKGVKMKNPVEKKKQIYLQYDRFITVNRIPVSLTWNIFESSANELIGKKSGEVKITAISYPKEQESYNPIQ